MSATRRDLPLRSGHVVEHEVLPELKQHRSRDGTAIESREWATDWRGAEGIPGRVRRAPEDFLSADEIQAVGKGRRFWKWHFPAPGSRKGQYRQPLYCGCGCLS